MKLQSPRSPAYKWNLFLLSLTATQNAVADVNMKDASYLKTFDDVISSRDRRDLKLRRVYRSRSLHRGLFGFGWCSDLEKKLKVSGDQIELHDCHSPTPQVFQNSTSANGETLELRKDVYLHKKSGRILNAFDREGRLTLFLSAPSANSKSLEPQLPIQIRYAATGSIESLRTPEGETRPVTFSAAGFVTGVGARLRYKYDAESNLIKVTGVSSALPVVQHRYDALHNLVETRYSDQTTETVSYDADTDRPLAFKDRVGCREAYTFSSREKPLQIHARVERRCQSGPVHTTSYLFNYQRQSDGSVVLTDVRLQAGVDSRTGARSQAGRFADLHQGVKNE